LLGRIEHGTAVCGIGDRRSLFEIAHDVDWFPGTVY